MSFSFGLNVNEAILYLGEAFIFLLWINEAKAKAFETMWNLYMSVGVMEDYKLRDLRASHTLGWSWNWNFAGRHFFLFIMNRKSES